MPATPSTDSTTQGSNTPDEAPTRRIRQAPDEAPTRRRAPAPHGYSTLRQPGSAPTQQNGYPGSQPAGYSPPQRGGYSAPQQVGPPLVEQRGYPPRALNVPSPEDEGYPPLYQARYPAAQYGHPSMPGANVPAVPNQQPIGRVPGGPTRDASSVQYFYAPQVQPAAGASHPPGAPALNVQGFWHDMGLLGQGAGVVGFLLLIFFFLPWFFTPDFTSGNISSKSTTPTVSYSGWHTASGLSLFDRTSSFTLFPHLWLVLICALALIVVGVLLGARRIGLRPAAILTSALALCALLLEFLFLIQANSIQAAVEFASGEKLNQTVYGVSWGFWLAVIVTIVGLGVGGFTLMQTYANRGTGSMPRVPGGSSHRPGQYPYPTA